MSCFSHLGASYHESPIRTSCLPSLLTSATATPSERNLPSMTVFFQETGDSLSAPTAEAAIRSIADQPRAAVVRVCLRMGESSPIEERFASDLPREAHDT